jgi:DNA sulfur modification protein DndD
MMLEKLTVENFRQFLGRQEIIFATAKKKNVTLIHAENGFGKTALLNALLWAFYGQEGLSPDFEHPERILHEQLTSEGDPSATATVTLVFSDGSDRYTLTRSLSLAQQMDDCKSRLKLEVLRQGGTYDLDKPHWVLERILPRGIAPFLLFNGERIDHLAMGRNSSEITAGIYQMLGLKILKETIEDLQHTKVRGQFMRELKENTDPETMAFIAKQQEYEAKLATLQLSLEACKTNQADGISEIKALDNNLAANRETRELQADRQKLQARKTSLEADFDDLNKRLKSLINQDGYVLFCVDLIQQGREISQRLRNEGKMPARVLNTFIQELLDAGTCICGTCLKPGSEEYLKVNNLLTIAGDHHFNNSVSVLDNAMGIVEGLITSTHSNLATWAKQRVKLRDEIEGINNDLLEIHQKIGDKDDAEVTHLESKREEWELKILEFIRNEGALGQEIKQLQIDLDAVKRRIAQSEQQADKAAKAQRRLNAVDEMIKLLQTILQNEMTDIREALNEEIDSYFRKIIDREYWAELTPEFTLRIMKRVIGSKGEELDVAMSTGQRQITSLVFIASLVALARNRAELPTILKDVEGGEYPLVMDSPFGQLGDAFRTGVAEHIPSLAPQVVILVSSTQYKGKVEDILEEKGRVGRRYVLSFSGPKKRDDAQATLTLAGKRHKIYTQDDDAEFTKIEAIED